MRKLLTVLLMGSLGLVSLGMSSLATAEQNPPQRSTIVPPSPAPTVSTTYTEMHPNSSQANNGMPIVTPNGETVSAPSTTTVVVPGSTTQVSMSPPSGGSIPGPNNFILAVGGTGSNIATVANSTGQIIGQGYGGAAAVAFNPQPNDGDVLLITVTNPRGTSTCHITITSEQNGGYSYNDAQYAGDVCSRLLPPVSMTNQPRSFTINPGDAVTANTSANITAVTTSAASAATVTPTATVAPTANKFYLTVTGNAANAATIQTMTGRILATGNPESGPQALTGSIQSGDILLVTVSNGTTIDNCHIQILNAEKGGYSYTDGQFPNDTCSTFLPPTSVTIQEGVFLITTSQQAPN